jgi:hypothetical protein
MPVSQFDQTEGGNRSHITKEVQGALTKDVSPPETPPSILRHTYVMLNLHAFSRVTFSQLSTFLSARAALPLRVFSWCAVLPPPPPRASTSLDDP